MKAHLIDKHFLVPRSRSSAKVKVKYQGHVSQKMGVSGALVFVCNVYVFQGATVTFQCEINSMVDDIKIIYKFKGTLFLPKILTRQF